MPTFSNNIVVICYLRYLLSKYFHIQSYSTSCASVTDGDDGGYSPRKCVRLYPLIWLEIWPVETVTPDTSIRHSERKHRSASFQMIEILFSLVHLELIPEEIDHCHHSNVEIVHINYSKLALFKNEEYLYFSWNKKYSFL